MKHGLIVLLYRKRMTAGEGTIADSNRPISGGLSMILTAYSIFV